MKIDLLKRQSSSRPYQHELILFTVTIIHGKFQFLADKLTVEVLSSELYEVDETTFFVNRCAEL